MDIKRIFAPLTTETVQSLKSGEQVLISGTIYTGRDAAHRKMVEGLCKGQPLPFDLKDQIIYYTGPTPAPPGRPIGSAGPTTSYRMDAYTPALLGQGLKGMIGKGPRGGEVLAAIKRHEAVYFAALGGAGALISRSIKKAEVIAYPELGPEAIYRLEVEDFPVVVINDIHGGDLYRDVNPDEVSEG
ncbi:MAG: Fe-S-containing hydro-lyase [Nitrospirota bacterium]|nr:Fe-S-containing hydro-lyase [Nitrospirota bacterium]